MQLTDKSKTIILKVILFVFDIIMLVFTCQDQAKHIERTLGN